VQYRIRLILRKYLDFEVYARNFKEAYNEAFRLASKKSDGDSWDNYATLDAYPITCAKHTLPFIHRKDASPEDPPPSPDTKQSRFVIVVSHIRLCELLIDAPSLHDAICHASQLNPKTIDESRWRTFSDAQLLEDDDENSIYPEETELLRIKVEGPTEHP
jgi:hypothetical protein